MFGSQKSLQIKILEKFRRIRSFDISRISVARKGKQKSAVLLETNWSIRPNPEGRIIIKPEGRIFNHKAEMIKNRKAEFDHKAE